MIYILSHTKRMTNMYPSLFNHELGKVRTTGMDGGLALGLKVNFARAVTDVEKLINKDLSFWNG